MKTYINKIEIQYMNELLLCKLWVVNTDSGCRIYCWAWSVYGAKQLRSMSSMKLLLVQVAGILIFNAEVEEAAGSLLLSSGDNSFFSSTASLISFCKQTRPSRFCIDIFDM